MQTSNATPRYDIYARIHKALRRYMFDTVARLGSADPADREACAQALDQAAALMRFCRKHLQHENDFVHPALEARHPGGAARIAGEHVHHLDEIAALEQHIDAARAAPAGMLSLYRALAVFVGDNLLHMQVEESAHNEMLWACYSDAELMGIEATIIASQPPEESAETMRWMLPAMHHGERVQTLSEARAHAPAPAFAGLMGLARSCLPEAERARLEAALASPERLAA